MKVFIYHKNTSGADAFEGARLRKTLKGACEVVDIPWVDSPQEGVEVAHFLAPDDLPALRSQKLAGVPCVVSAFYAEDDPNAAFLEPGSFFRFKKKGLQILNEADLVLVPDSRLASLAQKAGVTTHIEILEPAVRMNRFSQTANESKIFPRYFGVKPEVKTVVATGSYTDAKTINLIKKVAKAAPNLEFYFFGACKKYDRFSLAKKLCRLRRSKNLHFKDIVQDDVYRSALMNSSAYISNDSMRPDPIAPIEAFASKTQVVALSAPSPSPALIEGVSCYFFPSPEAMANYLISLNFGTAETTIESAYAIAKAHNLISYGNKLKGYYEALASGEYR